jgi:hypothetical protein
MRSAVRSTTPQPAAAIRFLHPQKRARGVAVRRFRFAGIMSDVSKTVATINRVIAEIVERIVNDEPVTQDVINRIPKDVRVRIPVSIRRADGVTGTGVILICNGQVTFEESVH